MLSLEECRRYFKNHDITDEELLNIRDRLYDLVENFYKMKLKELL